MTPATAIHGNWALDACKLRLVDGGETEPLGPSRVGLIHCRIHCRIQYGAYRFMAAHVVAADRRNPGAQSATNSPDFPDQTGTPI